MPPPPATPKYPSEFFEDGFVNVRSEAELEAEIAELKIQNDMLQKTISTLQEKLKITEKASQRWEAKYNELNTKKSYAEALKGAPSSGKSSSARFYQPKNPSQNGNNKDPSNSRSSSHVKLSK